MLERKMSTLKTTYLLVQQFTLYLYEAIIIFDLSQHNHYISNFFFVCYVKMAFIL